MSLLSIGNICFALVFSPFLLGIINRTKAFFAGRYEQPLLQPYYDIWKLLQKGSVYSRTTTLIFRMGPLIGLTVTLMAMMFIPLGVFPAMIGFQGDILWVIYLFGFSRFWYVIAALDTGSSFEAMGASREVQFSVFSEVALILGFLTLARYFGSFSLSDILLSLSISAWKDIAVVLGLIAAAFCVVFLVENARIPIDDPNTHLELTMIHEVMVLDHSGIDLAMIFYTSALKIWIFGTLLVKFVPVHFDHFWVNQLFFCLLLIGLAIFIGIIESIMARLKLLHIPQLLVGAGALSTLAFFLLLRG